MSSIRILILTRTTSSFRKGQRGYATKVLYKDLQKKTACDRAIAHFDDFYASFFGKRKWPQLRLGLLSPQKYVAIPNPFTGNLDQVTARLEALGAYSLHRLWEEARSQLAQERKEIDVKKDLGRIHSLEKTLESIAVTKRAEEMDILYQNMGQKREGTETLYGSAGLSSSGTGFDTDSRLISHPSQAAFVPPTRLKGLDEFAFDSEYYAGFLPQNLQKALDPDDDDSFVYARPEKMTPIKWPPVFLPYTFELGSGQEFPSARRDPASGLREYICVNGASIVPVLALDLNPSVDLLDLCSGPGTKSLMALSTMSLGSLTCNDVDSYRLNRVKKIFQEFTGTTTPDLVEYTRFNGKDYPGGKKYDRVLADVPCLNDRVSISIQDNNIFKVTRTRERLDLVNVQKAILLSALRTMKKSDGAVTVYSTCTLSPVENDGVIMHTLKETDVENLAVDMFGLLTLLKPLEMKGFCRVSRTRFGALIEPNIISNFGPMYVSRIIVEKKQPSGEEIVVPTTHQEEDQDKSNHNQDSETKT